MFNNAVLMLPEMCLMDTCTLFETLFYRLHFEFVDSQNKQRYFLTVVDRDSKFLMKMRMQRFV
jgi:hypothetical protein